MLGCHKESPRWPGAASPGPERCGSRPLARRDRSAWCLPEHCYRGCCLCISHSLPLPLSLPPPFPVTVCGQFKSHRLYLFISGGCAARRWRVGGARSPRLNIGRAGGAPRGRQGALQHHPPPNTHPSKERAGRCRAPCPEQSGAHAEVRGAPQGGGPAVHRGAEGPSPAEPGCCAAEGAANTCSPLGERESRSARRRGAPRAEETNSSRVWMLLARLRRGSAG